MHPHSIKYSFIHQFQWEKQQVKSHFKTRYKNISVEVKKHPFRAALLCGAYIAGTALIASISVYLIVLPIFVVLATEIIHYLNSSHFLSQKIPSFSLQIMLLFHRLKQKKQANEEKAAYGQDPRPVLLFLKAKSDYNGAFKRLDKVFNISGDNKKGVAELHKKYKIILLDDISNFHDLKADLKKIKNKIQILWILAHGHSMSIDLEDNQKIKNSNLDVEFSLLMNEKLSRDANIILYSCNTAKKIRGENIATKLSRILPGRTIWAPKFSPSKLDMTLKEGYAIEVKMWHFPTRLSYFKEKLANFFTLHPFKKVEYPKDATVKIKDGKICLR